MLIYFFTLKGERIELDISKKQSIIDFIADNRDELNDWLILNEYINRPLSVSLLNLILRFILNGELMHEIDPDVLKYVNTIYIIVNTNILQIFDQLRKITGNGTKIRRSRGVGSPFVTLLIKYGIDLSHQEIIKNIIDAMNEEDKIEKNSRIKIII